MKRNAEESAKKKAPGRRRMPRRKWTAGRGVLILIALMFSASAAVRFGAGPGPVLAQELAALRADDGKLPARESAAAGPACTDPPEIEALLGELARQQGFLDQRQAELASLEQSLKFAEEQIARRLGELKAAEAELSRLLSVSETAAEEDLARLTAVYENMKPKQAALLFEQMAPEFAAGFMGRMRADAAALIMAELPAEAAYAISVILAGRNARAPTR